MRGPVFPALNSTYYLNLIIALCAENTGSWGGHNLLKVVGSWSGSAGIQTLVVQNKYPCFNTLCSTISQGHGRNPIDKLKLKIGTSNRQPKWQKKGRNTGYQGKGAEHPCCGADGQCCQSKSRADTDSWFGVWGVAREVKGLVSGSWTGGQISVMTGAWLLIWEQELYHLPCFKYPSWGKAGRTCIGQLLEGKGSC